MEGSHFKPIAILGAGSWGTALALNLSRRGQVVRLWSIETSEVTAMLADRAHHQFLPGFAFPDTIYPMAELADAVKDVDDILIAVPSVGFRHTLEKLKPLLQPHVRLICASKGLDARTGQLFNEVVAEVLGTSCRFAVLSGPTFAKEVAAGLPTCVVLASQHTDILPELIKRFNSPNFRVFPSNDVIGVEIGCVAKNVIAIATGICDGMDLGTNARSALITLGLGEIIHLGTQMGGKLETFIGLSGMGDLILTCTDNQSRNRRLGLALGKQKDIQSAEREIGQVVEGKRNAELIDLLAKKHHVSMPICSAVWQILQGKQPARETLEEVLATVTLSS